MDDSIARLFNAVLSLEARAFVNWEGKIQKGKPEKYGLQGQLITKALLGNRVSFLFFKVYNFFYLEATRYHMACTDAEFEAAIKKAFKNQGRRYRDQQAKGAAIVEDCDAALAAV